MKILITLLVLVVSGGIITAQNNWTWAKDITKSGTHDAYAFSLAFDSQNNCISVAEVAKSGSNFFIVYKHDVNGTEVWNKEFAYQQNIQDAEVVVDANDNIIVAVEFRGNLTLGPNIYTATNSQEDIALFKLDNQGTLLWSIHDNKTAADENIKALTVDPSGNIYYGGWFQAVKTYVGTDSLMNGPSTYIAKYNANGAYQWVRSDAKDIQGMAANGTNLFVYGDLLLKSSYADSSFGSGTNASYLAKYLLDSTFVKVYLDKPTASANILPRALSIDSNGNLYATGFFTQSVTIAGQALTAVNSTDSYLSRYDSNLQPLGVYQINATGFTNGLSVAISSTGNYALLGQYTGQVRFAGDTLFEATGFAHDVFVLEFDASHAEVGAWQIYGEAGATATEIEEADIAAGTNNDFYVNGYYKGKASFNGVPSITGSKYEMFLAKIGTEGATSVTEIPDDVNICVYPNPFSDHIIVKNTKLSNLLLNVYSIDGRSITSARSAMPEIQIKLEGVSKGTYLLQISEAVSSRKLSSTLIVR